MRTLIAVAALATLAVCAQARERVTYGEAGRSLQCDEAAQKIVEAANPGGKAQNVKFAYHLNRKITAPCGMSTSTRARPTRSMSTTRRASLCRER